MDVRFDEEQLALREAVRALCVDHHDLARVATREGAAAAPATWKALAEMGVFGLLRGTGRGGLGRGLVDAAIVFEQLGAFLASGPLLWSTIAAPLVDGVQEGTIRATGLAASRAGPFVVEHAAESDVVLVVHDDRIERCDASSWSEPVGGEPFDPLTPVAAYRELRAGPVIGGPDDARRMRLAGTVLAAAMLVGGARGALDVAAEYARERRQFGVPIGSFQAIKHLLADMYVRVELARSSSYAAAAIFDDERAGDAVHAASAAKVLAGDAGIANARTAVQVLGGMGFTWAMLPHYFLKRAWVLEQAFGTGDNHALALGDAQAAGLSAR